MKNKKKNTPNTTNWPYLHWSRRSSAGGLCCSGPTSSWSAAHGSEQNKNMKDTLHWGFRHLSCSWFLKWICGHLGDLESFLLDQDHSEGQFSLSVVYLKRIWECYIEQCLKKQKQKNFIQLGLMTENTHATNNLAKTIILLSATSLSQVQCSSLSGIRILKKISCGRS